MAPEKIGRYEIRSELGRGGMATVYHGYDPRFEREVAIKLLPPELIHADPQFKVRFEREAKIIAQLEHPSIVPVYDVGDENNQPYYVMRYMGGGSLSERIRAGLFTIEEALKILEQIAPGMDEAHAKGIVHRDLKPGNILFSSKGVALISDFGIAKFTQGEVGNMTGSAIIGTPAYMAPEQAGGELVDGRTDIYALGVILYEMLTGKQPYKADTPLAVAIKHMTEPVPRILEANPNLPLWMEKVISTAMAKHKDERFSTAVEMVETIKAFLRGQAQPETRISGRQTMKAAMQDKTFAARTSLAHTSTAQPSTQPPIAMKKGFSPLIAVAGLVVVALIGSGIFLLGSGMLPFGEEAATSTPTTEATEVTESTSVPVVVDVTGTTESVTEVPPTETLAVTDTPAGPAIPIIGGADKLAVIRNDEIWVMNLDTTEAKQVTRDGVAKFNLQWIPGDPNTLLYMSGKTVKTVNIGTSDFVEQTIMSFVSAEYFEAFSVSPDGKQAAIAVNRELYIVPYDPTKLISMNKKSALIAYVESEGCLFYRDLAVTDVLWSDDGKQLAIKYNANLNGVTGDAIRLLEIKECKGLPPSRLDEFPFGRFQFPDKIVNFDWDGDLLFFINSNRRNGGFGDLLFYSSFTHKFDYYAPFENNCCYRDAAFSPDGTYVIFAFQDIRQGSDSPINLYYIPADSLGSPRTLEPLLANDFFTKRNEAPMPALRPAVQP